MTDFADIMAGYKATLTGGVRVVSAPQLFPTPVDVAAQMVQRLGLRCGDRVLEPSAGTGRLIDACYLSPWQDGGRLVAVELNVALADALYQKYGTRPPPTIEVIQRDFLECLPGTHPGTALGLFDRIIMNPPFKNGADIVHIRMARAFLNPEGGRLVAICANGPRQQEQLQPLASQWDELPAGTFNGTGVRAAILTIEAEQ